MSQIGISHSTLASVPATYTYPDTPDASSLALQFWYMSARWNQGNFDAAQGAEDNAQDRWSTAERQRHRSELCVEDSSSWRSSCPDFKSLSSKHCKYDGRLIARSVVFHDEALPSCRRIGSQHGLYNFLTPALTTNICISSITTGALLAITLFCTLPPSHHITASLRHQFNCPAVWLPWNDVAVCIITGWDGGFPIAAEIVCTHKEVVLEGDAWISWDSAGVVVRDCGFVCFAGGWVAGDWDGVQKVG